MLRSKYFLPILKENSIHSSVISHNLMLKAGMIRQHASGIYNWLPLGLKVLDNITKIIRSNLDKAGFIELLMPCVQNGDLWKESGRFDVYGQEMLKFKDRHNHDLLFGPTNEEVITDIVRNNIQSYKELPKIFYQIQWKFRDEIRPRFGVMRAREFLMKDAYSVDLDNENAIKTYNKVFETYMQIFRELNLKVIPLSAENGPIGGKLSHEFHVLAKTGESTLYYDKKFDNDNSNDLIYDAQLWQGVYAVTEDKYDKDQCPLQSDEIKIAKGIEVGHIFNFADRYSKTFNASVNDVQGKVVNLHMGSYGIGVSRVLAAFIEAYHDGIIWPENIAPFKVSIICLNIKDKKCYDLSTEIYQKLIETGIEETLDDTSDRPGAKFAVHDLIGSPLQVIIGSKKAKNNIVDLKSRANNKVEEMTSDMVICQLMNSLNVL